MSEITESLFVCTTCGKDFAFRSALASHSVIHLPYEARSHVCDTAGCGKRFADEKGLAHHRRTHAPDRPLHPCPLCGKAFVSARSLAKHTSQVHPAAHTRGGGSEGSEGGEGGSSEPAAAAGTPPTVAKASVSLAYCDVPGCGKVFQTANWLRVHKRWHAGLPPYQCPSCPGGFFSAALLRTHRTEEHALSSSKPRPPPLPQPRQPPQPPPPPLQPLLPPLPPSPHGRGSASERLRSALVELRQALLAAGHGRPLDLAALTELLSRPDADPSAIGARHLESLLFQSAARAEAQQSPSAFSEALESGAKKRRRVADCADTARPCSREEVTATAQRVGLNGTRADSSSSSVSSSCSTSSPPSSSSAFTSTSSGTDPMDTLYLLPGAQLVGRGSSVDASVGTVMDEGTSSLGCSANFGTSVGTSTEVSLAGVDFGTDPIENAATSEMGVGTGTDYHGMTNGVDFGTDPIDLVELLRGACGDEIRELVSTGTDPIEDLF